MLKWGEFSLCCCSNFVLIFVKTLLENPNVWLKIKFALQFLRRESVHSNKMAYNRSWQNSRLNCCLELERIFYSISLNEKLVSNMNKFLFQSVIWPVIIACTWTLKALKTFAWSVGLWSALKKARVKCWTPFFAIFQRQLRIFFERFFPFVDFNIAFFIL